VAEEAEAEDNASDDLAFLDNLPDQEEKVAKQRALLVSFESTKEANNSARARAQAEEEKLRHALELSVQQAPTKDTGRHLFAEERQRLLEDAAEHRALFLGIRRERCRAAVPVEKRKREGNDKEAGLSSAPKDVE
jgi:hypothetical protein